MVSKEEVISALKECYDPELGINIVDLGFIYDVKIENGKVKIKMTLTTPGCPMHAFFVHTVKEKVEKIKGVEEVNIELVWDPPWTPERMSKEARKKLMLE